MDTFYECLNRLHMIIVSIPFLLVLITGGCFSIILLSRIEPPIYKAKGYFDGPLPPSHRRSIRRSVCVVVKLPLLLISAGTISLIYFADLRNQLIIWILYSFIIGFASTILFLTNDIEGTEITEPIYLKDIKPIIKRLFKKPT